MPLSIDPAWEYYVPSQEMEEALEEDKSRNRGDKKGLSAYVETSDMESTPFSGFHFGHGNPNKDTTWIQGEKSSSTRLSYSMRRKGQRGRPPGWRVVRNCPTCGEAFETLCSKARIYCRRACVRVSADHLKNPEVRKKLSEAAKRRHESDREGSKRRQTLAVAGAVIQQKKGLTQKQKEARRKNMRIAQQVRTTKRREARLVEDDPR